MAQRLQMFLLTALAAVAAADYAMEGQSYSLACSDVSEKGGDIQYWMLNGSGEALSVGKHIKESLEVLDNGTIIFREVKKEHDGEHLCVTKMREVIKGYPVSMRVRPLPPMDVWQATYKAQFITGLIAALMCAFIFTAGCLVFKFRYREPQHVTLVSEEGGHYNQALEVDGDVKGHSTKM